MADLICPFCGNLGPEGAPLCPACGGPLLTAGTQVGPLPAARAGCPECGAEIPDPGNLVCVECLKPLTRPQDRAAGTRRDAPRALLLEFPGGLVTVPPGGSAVLGRDPAISDYARVFQRFENVSRLHATLRVDHGGSAWVRDEGSTNGTFVNGVPAVTGEAISLHDGDLLRLAADVEARVRLGEDTHG
ncbi:FHA domain-containing protein [Acrocarpospora macrocephala]|uniref:FHA domain-containing protein n=1 Tax=Acrocarpospora macrocephala TaxID=150177 RepID=A0A5M3X5F3_9ACTN|nr:FHA domain-containing protein [Acrocarpospora macrocephala]GES16334.1 hypothetical protein Amac_099320 [Acrocarpospora macrocephala]